MKYAQFASKALDLLWRSCAGRIFSPMLDLRLNNVIDDVLDDEEYGVHTPAEVGMCYA